MNITIALGGSVTIQNVAAVRARIADAFADHLAVTLDAGEVEAVDLSLLQLVEAARQHAAVAGKSLCLAAPSNPVLAGLLDRAGFLSDATPETLDFWFHGDLPQ